MMNVSKLKQLKKGMVIKNYKAMCELLDDKIKSGGSKTKQLKEWSRYFDWKKDGHNFIIEKKYDTPKAFTRYDKLELLLLNLLASSKNSNYLVFAPKGTLLKQLHILNKNYYYCRINKKNFAEYTQTQIKEVYDFFHSVDKATTQQFEQLLKLLKGKNLISYNTIDRVCQIVFDKSEIEIDDVLYVENEYGETETVVKTYIPKQSVIYREATKEEIEYSIRTRNDVMKSLNCYDMKQVVASGQYPDFIQIVTEKYIKDKNIRFFFKAYKIIFHKNYINRELNEMAQLFKLSPSKKKKLLQSNSSEQIQNVMKNANNRHEKAKDFINTESEFCDMFGLPDNNTSSFDNALFRSDPSYLDSFEKISKLLLDINQKNIIPSLRKFALKKKYKEKRKSDSKIEKK